MATGVKQEETGPAIFVDPMELIGLKLLNVGQRVEFSIISRPVEPALWHQRLGPYPPLAAVPDEIPTAVDIKPLD